MTAVQSLPGACPIENLEAAYFSVRRRGDLRSRRVGVCVQARLAEVYPRIQGVQPGCSYSVRRGDSRSDLWRCRYSALSLPPADYRQRPPCSASKSASHHIWTTRDVGRRQPRAPHPIKSPLATRCREAQSGDGSTWALWPSSPWTGGCTQSTSASGWRPGKPVAVR
jgi:hypothetical protein